MEKLSNAIKMARAARQGQDHGLTAAEDLVAATAALAAANRGQVARRQGNIVDAEWAALPPYDPDPEQLYRHLVFPRGGTALATPFDMLRTKVLQEMKKNGWRRLAITSPTAGCGKSTVALNLAFSLSRNPELRTLLCDLDLRRPSLAGMLGAAPQANFFSVLAGRVDIRDCALCYRGNLAIALNQKAFRSPAELMQLSNVAPVLAQMQDDFQPDLMIFDLPPMLAADDALAFASNVDCVLLVAAAEQTTVAEVDVAERELAARTNVLGVVLNKARYDETGAGYEYG